MSRLEMSLLRSAVVMVVVVFCCSLAAAAEQRPDIEIAQTTIDSAGVSWQPAISFKSAVLTVSGPGDLSLRREFAAGEALAFRVDDTNQATLEDGQYAWELRFSPVTDEGVKEALRAARESGDASEIDALKKQGKLPAGPSVTSGYFRVQGGSVVVADAAEASTRRGGGRVEPSGSAQTVDTDSPVPTKDQVILDDLIVDGSACIGMDCVNGESFGFDTIRLKENNLRIRAVDTSSTSSFPSRDWQITFNDSANGGANKFSIDDIDGGRTPFTLEAGAPSHSLYVDDGGRLGLGTSVPYVELHIVDGDTPTVRLDQDGSSGWAAQRWDVAGNETNFFIRDATHGSTLPFRIRPGAPTSSIEIAADGDVGLGTASPAEELHVFRSTNSEVRAALENSNARWFIGVNAIAGDANAFLISRDASGGAEVVIRKRLDGSGTATLLVNGSIQATNLTFSSSRALKTDLTEIDPKEVVGLLAGLDVSSWRYRTDADSVRHIGPMAEDFYQAFGLGRDPEHISVADMSGVLLAAVKGLAEKVEALEEEKADLAKRLAALEQGQ